jgi:hypothetical protein
MKKHESVLLATWHRKLHQEWLPHWVDMPQTQFDWWYLLINALGDAED